MLEAYEKYRVHATQKEEVFDIVIDEKIHPLTITERKGQVVTGVVGKELFWGTMHTKNARLTPELWIEVKGLISLPLVVEKKLVLPATEGEIAVVYYLYFEEVEPSIEAYQAIADAMFLMGIADEDLLTVIKTPTCIEGEDLNIVSGFSLELPTVCGGHPCKEQEQLVDFADKVRYTLSFMATEERAAILVDDNHFEQWMQPVAV